MFLPITVPSALQTVLAIRSDQSGSSAIEYGLIAGSLSIVIVVSVLALGNQLGETFSAINSTVAAHN